MITDKQIKEWRTLCDAATPGPWEADIDDPGTEGEMWTGKFYVIDGDETWCTYGGASTDGPDMTELQRAANARFCAVARTALPALLEELEKLRKGGQR